MKVTPLVIHNNAVYCLAVVIILSLFIKRRPGWYLLALVLTTAAGTFLTVSGRSHLTMPAAICILTLVFAIERQEWLAIFRQCLTAVFLSWCFITPFSCLIMMIAPAWHDGFGCNILSGVAIMAYAVLLRWIPGISRRLQAVDLNRYVIVLELLVLLFFTLVLPLYFPVFGVESKRQIGLFTLLFFFFLAFVGFILHRMQNVQQQRRELERRLRQQQHFKQQVERQFDTVVSLKHYYSKLYQSMAPLVRSHDEDKLEAYFDRYIAVVHGEYIEKTASLSHIKNEIIKNLLDITAAQVELMEGISLELSVEGAVEFSGEIEMDIFEVLCNFLDNALRELENQKEGLLRIVLAGDENTVSIEVSNTLSAFVDIEKLYGSKPDNNNLHGHGLFRVREIVCKRSQMEHFTDVKEMYCGKKVLKQQIIVHR